jgi:hypothetical protein
VRPEGGWLQEMRQHRVRSPSEGSDRRLDRLRGLPARGGEKGLGLGFTRKLVIGMAACASDQASAANARGGSPRPRTLVLDGTSDITSRGWQLLTHY